jgi:hypothetical protein
MGSGRSENAADAPQQGAFPAGLIGAEPIDLAAVRQGERIVGQVTGILKDLAVGFEKGKNHPHSGRVNGSTGAVEPFLSEACSFGVTPTRQGATSLMTH